MEEYTKKAYAKINLGLDVLRRREDGYHELRMIMQTVGIFDVITFSKTEEDGVITLTTNVPKLPCDDKNLMVKAARKMWETYNISGGLTMTLEKNIPMAAGLAGGSTDAACVIRGINDLYGLNLSDEELCKTGVTIGADVPYCITGGCCLAEGIGEVLTPLPEVLTKTAVVVLKPDFDVSTKYVYENLHADTLTEHPDIDAQIHSIEEANLKECAGLCGNVLERVTVVRYPEIDEIKKDMTEAGAIGAMMSGSGPSVFGLYESADKAKEAAESMKKKYPRAAVFATEFVSRENISGKDKD